MRRRIVCLATIVAALGLLGGLRAFAHECNDPQETDCHPTPVVPDWRGGNYIPLFDIDRDCSNTSADDCGSAGHDSDGDGDIDGDDQRYDAQRWRDECAQQGQEESNQFCVWVDFGNSLFTEGEVDPNAEPNELHAGTGGSHCFLFEFAHDCEDHYTGGNSEAVHDAHGGAVYVDLCLAANPDSEYCDDGLEDTQVGVTVMDHNPCGAFVPVIACTDEYHVIRPFDTDRTVEQMDESAAYTQVIADDPATYVCGREGFPSYFDGCHELIDAIDPRP